MKHYKPFQFKQFSIEQNNAAMKVGTDSVLLGSWATISTNDRVLDIGTGTGLLSLMLAQKVEGICAIDAVEIDKTASMDAEINFMNSNWKDSITLHNIDFNDYNSLVLYDIIITNPPFFEGLAPNNVTRSIARNASNKLSYKGLITNASNLLSPNGYFYLILPIGSLQKVIDLSQVNNLYVVKQLNIRPKEEKPINRVLLKLTRSSHNSNSVQCEELVIRNNHNSYTREHIEFTKDYLL